MKYSHFIHNFICLSRANPVRVHSDDIALCVCVWLWSTCGVVGEMMSLVLFLLSLSLVRLVKINSHVSQSCIIYTHYNYTRIDTFIAFIIHIGTYFNVKRENMCVCANAEESGRPFVLVTYLSHCVFFAIVIVSLFVVFISVVLFRPIPIPITLFTTHTHTALAFIFKYIWC